MTKPDKRITKSLELGTTPRGFAKATFTDRYGLTCSVQESSLATEDCIWLGVESSDRMHLTQENVRLLLPLLKRFVKTGRLGE